MLGSLRAVCRMKVALAPRGPWIVRGKAEPVLLQAQSGRPQMVQQPLLGRDGQPLLPASSLKGVLRSTAERILRSCEAEESSGPVPFACIPFVQKRASDKKPGEDLKGVARRSIACSQLLEWRDANREQRRGETPADDEDDELPAPGVYGQLCKACQLFGATTHAGLLRIEDSAPGTYERGRRSHVAIDRLTGGVGEGPFVEELVLAGQGLAVELSITNFALWQIGLVGLALQEIDRGYAAIGGGTRKGHGQVGARVTELDIWYAKAFYPVERGIVSAQPETEGAAAPLLPRLAAEQAEGWREADRVRVRLDEADAQELIAACVAGPWRRAIGADEGGAADA